MLHKVEKDARGSRSKQKLIVYTINFFVFQHLKKCVKSVNADKSLTKSQGPSRKLTKSQSRKTTSSKTKMSAGNITFKLKVNEDKDNYDDIVMSRSKTVGDLYSTVLKRAGITKNDEILFFTFSVMELALDEGIAKSGKWKTIPLSFLTSIVHVKVKYTNEARQRAAWM